MKCSFFLGFFLYGLSLFGQNGAYPLGYWYGQLDLMGTKHEILLFVSSEYNAKTKKSLKGKFVIELLNPVDSSSFPVRVNPVEISTSKFKFTIKDLNLTYSGVPHVGLDGLDGVLEQSGVKANLKFSTKRSPFVIPKRPQTPTPPFTYHSRDVKVVHVKEKFQLAGTLTLPADTTKPFPLVVLASGSGAQNRDMEVFGHKLFWVIADHFAKNGIGSLRFDDRGVGTSGGVFSKTSLVGFSEDVESALDYLRTKTSFKSNVIGILGHSEGAMHAWMVAKRRTDVDFIISLAGPAVSGRQIIEQQQYDIARLESEELAIWTRDLFRGVMDKVSQRSDIRRADKAITKFIKNHFKNASPEIQMKNPLEDLLQTLPVLLNTQWGREFISWNPDDYMPSYKGKILYIIGDKDLQVNPEMNFNGFLKYIHIYDRELFGALTFENLNHLLQTCKTCTLEEYGELEETISKFILNEMVVFLRK